MTALAYTCPRCGRTSYHPTDVAEGYCGNCHDWTGGNPLAGSGGNGNQPAGSGGNEEAS